MSNDKFVRMSGSTDTSKETNIPFVMNLEKAAAKISRYSFCNDAFDLSFPMSKPTAAEKASENKIPAKLKDTVAMFYADSTTANQKQHILAHSPVRRSVLGKRVLLTDRKHSFEHLRARHLIFSTFRVGVIQSGQLVTTFLTDQIEYESTNAELVVQGHITPLEEEMLNEEWEKNEWDKRWKQFPKSMLNAFLKLQSAILLMRFYEQIAGRYCSTKTWDKLTKDSFKSAKRKAEKYKDVKGGTMILGKKMFHTCLWASAISFLSDYTVQQCILLVGHCVYYRHQRRLMRERIMKRKKKGVIKVGDEDNEDVDEDDLKKDCGAGGIGLSFAMKSSNLMISRGTSWIVSSGSGAIGSVIYPGWGTLFGTQMGDVIVGALIDS